MRRGRGGGGREGGERRRRERRGVWGEGGEGVSSYRVGTGQSIKSASLAQQVHKPVSPNSAKLCLAKLGFGQTKFGQSCHCRRVGHVEVQHFWERRIFTEEEGCSTSAGHSERHVNASERVVQSRSFTVRFSSRACGRGGPPRTSTTPCEEGSSVLLPVVDPVDPLAQIPRWTPCWVRQRWPTRLRLSQHLRRQSAQHMAQKSLRCLTGRTPNLLFIL